MAVVALFDLIGRYFWLIAIVIAAVNYLLIDLFADEQDRQVDQARRRSYLARFAVLSSVPWVVMGFAQIVGGVPNLWAFLRPQDGNPFVWSWYASILATYIVFICWVFFRDGARTAAELRLVKARGLTRSGAAGAGWIKVGALALLPFAAFWLWGASRLDVPLP